MAIDTPNQETTTNDILGAVIYTDGSCKFQNPGFIGWGAHGYIYKKTDSDKPILVEGHLVTNKGYLRHNHTQKSVEYVEPVSYLDFTGSSLVIGTNNSAEILAICNSLEQLAGMNVTVISILTDSEYALNGLTKWCEGWERHNWLKADGSYVVNHEHWIRTYRVYKDLKAKGVSVSLAWIRGHDDNFGNTHADILAGIGTNYSMDRVLKNEFKISESKNYWKQDIEKHPFLNFKRVYFNSVVQYNMKGQYFQADNGGADNTIGKRIPETGLAVVKLKEADPVIEAVKHRQYEIAKELNAIIMMKLDRVFCKEVYPYIVDHGKYCLLGGKGNVNVNFFDKKPVTIEVNPTGLSMRAIESFNLLEELLDKFLSYKESGFDVADNNIQLHAHDITSIFYNKEEKTVKKEIVTKLTLKPEFTVGFTDMSIDITEPYEGKDCKLKVPLILGTDLLPRNNLKKLETHNPTIWLITWRESKNSLRYATVIECDSGVGIWSNFFADRIFFAVSH